MPQLEPIETIFDQMKNLLASINTKMGVVARGTRAGGAAQPAGTVPSTEPARGFLDLINDTIGGIGKKLGIETAGLQKREIDQAKGQMETDLEVLKTAREEAKLARDAVDLAMQQVRDARKALLEARQLGGDVAGAKKAVQDALGKLPELQKVGKEKTEREEAATRKFQESNKGHEEAKAKLAGMGGKGFNVDFGKLSGGLEKAAFGAQAMGMGDARGHDSFSGAMKSGDVAGMLGQTAAIAKNIPLAMAGDPIAIAQLGKEALTMTVDNIKAIGGHVKAIGQAGAKLMESERFEDIAGIGLEAGEHAGKAVGRAVGGPILGPVIEKMIDMNPILQFHKALFAAIGTIRKWNDQLHNANMRFAEFSSAMAAVQARQQFRDIRLSQQRGQRRAASAEGLAESRHELNERFSVVEDAVAIFKNRFMTIVDKAILVILDFHPVIAPLLNFLRKWMDDERDTGFVQRLFDVADEEGRRRNANNRMRPHERPH